MKRFRLIISLVIWTVFLAMPLAETAKADTDLMNNLQRSRDALLRQRGELQDADARIGAQISELGQQQSRVEAYLRDTDSALRNVESAMRGN